MTVRFDSTPSNSENVQKQKFSEGKARTLSRTISKIKLTNLESVSNAETISKTAQMKPTSKTVTFQDMKDHQAQIDPGTNPTVTKTDQVGQETLAHHSTPAEHLKVFSEIFGTKGIDGEIGNLPEVKTIYNRMSIYANASGTTPDMMVGNLKRGREVAKEIANSDFKTNTKQYTAHDLAAFDWFLRAQHAKLDQLYLKGTTKMPDPDHHIAQFIIQVKGTNRGNEREPYERGSSHCPEERKEIRSSVIACENGKHICFSDKSKKELLKQGIEPSNIKLFDEVGIGIDAAGKDAAGVKFTTPGDTSRTYLFMLFNEREIPVVLMKAESNPVDGLLSMDTLKHGAQLRKKFMTPDENVPFPDLKEDKLPPHILVLLKDVKILSGKDGSELRNSYDALEKTTQFQNNYALPQLKTHLENQLKLGKLDGEQTESTQKLLNAIDQIFNKALEQNDSKYKLIPRSREVILPTLQEMLENKVKFVPQSP